MSKKHSKNSDYHYAERRDNAARMQSQKAERKKTTRREKILYFAAFLLLIAALIIWVITRKNGMTESLAPLYGGVSGVGLILLSFSYKRERDKASKACLVLGVIAILLSAFILLVNLGVLNWG
ncbi:MAG: hypothetical protein K6D56_01955 [Clostridia bacterium]|nr:hypothetical protein [Clostridia bacterium]